MLTRKLVCANTERHPQVKCRSVPGGLLNPSASAGLRASPGGGRVIMKMTPLEMHLSVHPSAAQRRLMPNILGFPHPHHSSTAPASCPSSNAPASCPSSRPSYLERKRESEREIYSG
jgi:hypothetical protein